MRFVKDGGGGHLFESNEQKKQFLHLFKNGPLMTQQTTDEESIGVKRLQLLTLRLMLREVNALEEVLVTTVVDRVMELILDMTGNQRGEGRYDALMEGLRCMINLLQRGDRPLRDHFTKRVVVVVVPRANDSHFYESVLDVRNHDPLSYELLSHVARLIFYNTFDKDNCESFVGCSQGVIQLIFAEMNRAMEGISNEEGSRPFFAQFLVDGLKFFYSVTHHMEDQQDAVLMHYFEAFMTFVKHAFWHYPTKKQLLTEVCLRILHVLMNLHENVLVLLLTEKPEGEEERVLNGNALVLLLSIFIENADQREMIHSSDLQPVPVVLTRAARRIPIVKDALQQWILFDNWPQVLRKPTIPEKFLLQFEQQDANRIRRQERENGTSSAMTDEESHEDDHQVANADMEQQVMFPNPENLIKRFFVHFLTETNYELKSVMSEFIFVLCDEDTQQFVEQVGLGYAAGLLAERGLFGALAG